MVGWHDDDFDGGGFFFAISRWIVLGKGVVRVPKWMDGWMDGWGLFGDSEVPLFRGGAESCRDPSCIDEPFRDSSNLYWQWTMEPALF